MKLRQFAKDYGLNTRTENLLWQLKSRTDIGDITDNRISKFYDNNIEKVLIIAAKEPKMLYMCPGIGRKIAENVISAVYNYLDDPSTPDSKETVNLLQADEFMPQPRIRRDTSINYIHFDMEMFSHCKPKDVELYKHLTFTVTSHTNKKYANSHCAIVLEKDMGDDEVVIVEQMPLSQLKRLHKFIEMVFELDR